ncbi:shikimate kinase [Candidatus Marinamargulisbacteria bacterium SCGC AG-410-N11]|nr:shikimate kinase [Candidatus Marinamargulisbacteria bacterium SCGC AG-410-N11]
MKQSITLIGMCGVGKTVIGKQLSKLLTYRFFDTDQLIESSISQTIYNFINNNDEKLFLELEEQLILNFDITPKMIISTGGSVIYSSLAMSYLKKNTIVIFLNDTAHNIYSRLNNLSTRGVVFKGADNFYDLFNSRYPLYSKYSDITVTIKSPFNVKIQSQNLLSLIKPQLEL